MPEGNFSKADIVCPFYRRSCEGKLNRIVCEGVSECSTLAQTWSGKKRMQKHLKGYCCENYSECPIYRMLMREKYNEDID